MEGTRGEEEKMKEKWDWSIAQLRSSPGKTKEASPGVLGQLLPLAEISAGFYLKISC